MNDDSLENNENATSPSLLNVKTLAFVAVGAAGLLLLNGVGMNSAQLPPKVPNAPPIVLPNLKPSMSGLGVSPLTLPSKTGQVIDQGLSVMGEMLETVNDANGVVKNGVQSVNKMFNQSEIRSAERQATNSAKSATVPDPSSQVKP